MSEQERALATKDRLIDSLTKHLDWYKSRFPCVGCGDMPDEECPRHGRTPAELWEAITLLQQRLMGGKPPCPDCENGTAAGERCASCEVEHDWRLTPQGTVRIVRTDLPAIVDEEAYAVYLDRDELERMSVALRLEDLGADRTGDV